jgi:hypothetical protein
MVKTVSDTVLNMTLKQKLLILLCSLSLCAALLQAQDRMPTYLLSQLAEGIADGPAALRADLAQIALTEMAAEYANEAQQARHEMQRRGKKANLARWSGEVQKLADDYANLAETITQATPVEVSTGPDGSLYMHVAGQLVVASIPRMNEQSAFEQRVVTRFCSLNRCADLVDVPVTAAAATRRRARATTLWSFSQDAGPTCSSPDGLVFMYRNMDDLGQKRETCARVVAELNALATTIKTELAAGARVDWQRLSIVTSADGDEQVILNSTGHTLRLSLPTLAPRQELLKRIRPWLTAKVNGTPYTLVITHADQLMAPARQ